MILEKLRNDLKNAMKNKQVLEKTVIQMLMTALTGKAKEKSPDGSVSLTAEEEMAVVRKELNQTKDSLEDALKYDRPDLATELQAKIEIINTYLPQQLSEDEIKEVVKMTCKVLGMSLKDLNMGVLMKELKAGLAGRADMGLVNKVIKNMKADA